MNTTPLITIIIPVYNAEKYLYQCIESILSQTFKDLELLLIDDGSSDSSGEICDEYSLKDNRIRVFHKKNGGVSCARNLGLLEAKGEWITFIDADDFISETFLDNLLKPIFSSKKIDYVQAGCSNYVNNGQISIEQQYEYKEDNDPIFLARNIRGLIVSKLFKTSVIQKNYLIFDEKIIIAEDMIFTFDYLSHVKNYVFLPEIGYFYRRHPESATKVDKTLSFDDSYTIYCHYRKSLFNYISNFSLSLEDISKRIVDLSLFFEDSLLALYKNKVSRKIRLKCLYQCRDDVSLICYQKKKSLKLVFNIFLLKHHFKIYDFLMSVLGGVYRFIRYMNNN